MVGLMKREHKVYVMHHSRKVVQVRDCNKAYAEALRKAAEEIEGQTEYVLDGRIWTTGDGWWHFEASTSKD